LPFEANPQVTNLNQSTTRIATRSGWLASRMIMETCQPQNTRAFGTLYARQGTPYLCSQATLDILQRLPLMNDLQAVCLGNAVREAIEINSEKKPSPAKRAPIDRLMVAIARPTVVWEADIIIRCSAPLIQYSFDG